MPGHGPIKVALVGESDDWKHRSIAIQAGADYFLSKPADPVEIANLFKHFSATELDKEWKILLADDDLYFARAVGSLLEREGFRFKYVTDALTVLDQMNEFRPDLVILDLVMPGVSGFELCRMIRMTPGFLNIPIFLATARTGADVRVSTFRSGADDFIQKPIVREELLARIWSRIERSRVLLEASQRDPVTGLLLRRAAGEMLAPRMAELRRRQGTMALALIDLDHFKHVNDRHGHLIGDQVLSTIGKLLALRARATDLCSRWGGEEFLYVLFGTDAENAVAPLNRLQEELKDVVFTNFEKETFHVSFSAGVAGYPQDGETLEELLKVADTRLYAAKRNGRARVEVTD